MRARWEHAASRRLLVALLAFGLACGGPPAATGHAPTAADTALLDDLEHASFEYFWRTANPANGLVPDRYPTPSFSSIAAVGFGLTLYPVGVERGYITRAAARDRVLATLRFFRDAPQGDAATGVAGDHGFYYHFLDLHTGTRYAESELSSVDTALLLAGALFCREYFAGPDPAEVELRRIADDLLARVDWRWMQARPGAIAMGWAPESGFIAYDWLGYNEGMIVVLLALGAPTLAVDPAAWDTWTSRYDQTWGTRYGQQYLGFAPLFGHQYSEVWIDFRGIRDRYMRAHGLDYFENSRRATYAQQAYAIANPEGFRDYGANVWGLTACDGPGELTLTIDGKPRMFHDYMARGLATHDDGTIAPTAMASSLPFAPEIVLPGLRDLRRRYGARLLGAYGFFDAFNPSFPLDAHPAHGSVAPGAGWVDQDYLGIDEGPIAAMIENYRSGLIWRVMRNSAYLRRALARAGFTGGWLEVPP